MENSTRKKNTMIIAGMVLLTVLAFLLINLFSDSDALEVGQGPNVPDLIQEIEQLESQILELEVVYGDQLKDNSVNSKLLDEKRDEINRYTQQIEDLEKKIDRLERSGRADKSTIERLRQKLAEVKEAELAILRKEVEFLYMENRRMIGEIDTLRIKDTANQFASVEIERLRTQLRDCNESKASTDATLTGTRSNNPNGLTIEQVAREIKLAQDELVKFEYFRNSVSSKNTFARSTKAKKLKTILVKYNVTNEFHDDFFSGKRMHLQMIDAHDNPIASKNVSMALFKGEGTEKMGHPGTYKSGEGITIPIERPEWAKGAYRIFMYVGGKKVGEEKILII